MNSESASLITALRANPGIIAALALCVGPALVLTLIGFIMRGSGASVRPIVFIAGLFLPIVIPFVIGQIVIARAPLPKQPSAALTVNSGQFTDRAKLFGPGIPAELIREAKSGLPGILDEAEAAEVGMTANGETVLIAQFPGEDETKRASAAYWNGFQLRNTRGDEENGWRATRMQGDYVEMLRTGRQLFVWTGLTPEAAAARRAASDLDSQFPELKPVPQPPLFPALQPLADFFAPASIKFIGMVLLVCIYSLWFFKGIGWCARAQPVPGARILPESELVSRVMAINHLDVPFTLTRGDKPNELIADWRYADAKWLDLARAHGVRRTFRMKLTLDESSHTVRATDYTAEFDWSVGRSSASIQWKAAMGVVFFQKEQQTIFGLQVDEQGYLSPVMSYTYKFDLSEMKSPIITTIIQSGWTWRPTAWQGPKALRWLTE
ncbi:MAG: hypothetical protein NTV80_03455 [Verrucomicrobia bacterium]|nr:hypothetical protein [Verrucomicrobiota bacterium]